MSTPLSDIDNECSLSAVFSPSLFFSPRVPAPAQPIVVLAQQSPFQSPSKLDGLNVLAEGCIASAEKEKLRRSVGVSDSLDSGERSVSQAHATEERSTFSLADFSLISQLDMIDAFEDNARDRTVPSVSVSAPVAVCVNVAASSNGSSRGSGTGSSHHASRLPRTTISSQLSRRTAGARTSTGREKSLPRRRSAQRLSDEVGGQLRSKCNGSSNSSSDSSRDAIAVVSKRKRLLEDGNGVPCEKDGKKKLSQSTRSVS